MFDFESCGLITERDLDALLRWLLSLAPQCPDEPSLIEFVKREAAGSENLSGPGSSVAQDATAAQELLPESMEWRSLFAAVLRAPESREARQNLDKGVPPRVDFSTFCHLLTVVRVSVQNEFEGKWDDIDASVSLGKQRSSCLEGVSSPRRERGRLTVSQAHLVTQQARLAFSDRELRRIFFGDGLRFRGNRTRISFLEF